LSSIGIGHAQQSEENGALGEPGGEFIGYAASGNRICLANGPPSDSDTTASENEK
jgi:hypothetical protein